VTEVSYGGRGFCIAAETRKAIIATGELSFLLEISCPFPEFLVTQPWPCLCIPRTLFNLFRVVEYFRTFFLSRRVQLHRDRVVVPNLIPWHRSHHSVFSRKFLSIASNATSNQPRIFRGFHRTNLARTMFSKAVVC